LTYTPSRKHERPPDRSLAGVATHRVAGARELSQTSGRRAGFDCSRARDAGAWQHDRPDARIRQGGSAASRHPTGCVTTSGRLISTV